ncbi:MAG: ABC transporter ATP-binding protein [Planctomycetes bacterium]|nr:ABC transporter ATP-binding protein [Planctomycetota bacterium]
MVTGLLAPSSGSARVFGHDCYRERPQVMRHVGYLPDEPTFHDYLRGSEVLQFVAEMHGLDRTSRAARIGALVERLDLGEALDDFAVHYSKGMRKRRALACALLHGPQLLILDEPTNGLDPFAMRTLYALIAELAYDGVAVFYSTHLLDQAERVCQRIAILKGARLAAMGTPEQLRGSLAPGASLEDAFFAVVAERSASAPAESPPGVPV